MLRIAINGYGRIGRNILRAYYERPELGEHMTIVAINDQGNVAINAHLTRFDSVHGQFHQPVNHDDETLFIGEDAIRVLAERDPAKLPWRALQVDIVLECTGLFTERENAAKHLQAGARKVLISAPGKDVDATVVFGINHGLLTAEHRIVSNASCTTNCLAPVVQPLSATLGIETGFMTTVHAYTNDQHLVDVYHEDLYRARSATLSMIPTRTGAAKAIGLVLPELSGKLDGMAVRVPTANVSLVDLTFTASRATTATEVNDIMQQAARGPLGEVLAYTEEPMVSVDFNHSAYSSIFDGSHTRVSGQLVKVLAWYGNEWGFSNRMLDTCLVMGRDL